MRIESLGLEAQRHRWAQYSQGTLVHSDFARETPSLRRPTYKEPNLLSRLPTNLNIGSSYRPPSYCKCVWQQCVEKRASSCVNFLTLRNIGHFCFWWVAGLQDIEAKVADVEAEYAGVKAELEKAKLVVTEPFYKRRQELVAGKSEPTKEELEGFPDTPASPGSPSGNRGIPYFWLSVFRGHSTIAEYVTKRDEEALEHLEDVRILSPTGGGPGIRIEFHFGKNKFFKQKVLWKQIRLSESHSALLGVQEEDLEGESRRSTACVFDPAHQDTLAHLMDLQPRPLLAMAATENDRERALYRNT
eukprot:1182311-Prorocentrum_minimum.AAC.2